MALYIIGLLVGVMVGAVVGGRYVRWSLQYDELVKLIEYHTCPQGEKCPICDYFGHGG